MRRTKDVKRYIETEIKFYHETKKEYEQLVNDIIESSGGNDSDGSSSSIGGSVTEYKAMALVSNPRLSHMEKTMKAIERTINSLEPDQKRFISMKYWENRYTMDGIAVELKYNKRTLYKWRDKICMDVAKDLGMID